MRKKFKIVTLIFVVALFAAYYFYYETKNNTPKKNNTLDSNLFSKDNLTTSDSTNSDESAVLALSSEKAISLFESSSDSVSALEIIEQLLSTENETLAHELLKELHNRCQYKDSFSSPIGDPKSWSFIKIQEYCDKYDTTFFQKLVDEGVSFISPNPQISKLIFAEETDIDIISQHFLDMLHQMYYGSSDFIADVSELIHYYSNEFLVPLNLGQSENINTYDIQRVQMVAIELFACQRNGGCGPDSYNVLINCTVDTSCKQGWSLMDYYQNTMSPNNFNEVLSILDYIRRYGRLNNL